MKHILDKIYSQIQWQPIPVLLPGKSHGWRSLVGCSPWGRKESDTTEWLHFHFSLSCTGEENGNPLHCSCLENPRDGEPVGLQSMGSQRVGHDWSDLAAAACSFYSCFLESFYHKWMLNFVKGFGIVNKAEIDVFLELSCFFDDSVDVGNLISCSSAFSKTSLNIWK